MSIYVLFIAEGARAAAREARLRTALEELEHAAEKCAHVGLFAQANNWQLVSLCAAEVETTCRSTVARWQKDKLRKEARNKLLQVAVLMRSIVEETDNATPNQKTILTAQRDSKDRLTVVVGRMKEESGST